MAISSWHYAVILLKNENIPIFSAHGMPNLFGALETRSHNPAMKLFIASVKSLQTNTAWRSYPLLIYTISNTDDYEVWWCWKRSQLPCWLLITNICLIIELQNYLYFQKFPNKLSSHCIYSLPTCLPLCLCINLCALCFYTNCTWTECFTRLVGHIAKEKVQNQELCLINTCLR